MILKTSKDTISFLIKGNLPAQNSQQAMQQARFQQAPPKPKQEQLTETRNEEEVQKKEKPKAQPVKAEVKIGRNDPCPCGSGKKYKNCHGQ